MAIKSMTAQNYNYDDLLPKGQTIEIERPIELSHDPDFEEAMLSFLIEKISNRDIKFKC